MAYIPSLADLPPENTASSSGGGYVPSLADLPPETVNTVIGNLPNMPLMGSPNAFINQDMIRNIINAAGGNAPGMNIIGRPLSGTVNVIGRVGENAINNVKTARSVPGLQEAATQAGAEADQATQAYQQAQNEAKIATGKQDPAALEFAKGQTEAKMPGLLPDRQINPIDTATAAADAKAAHEAALAKQEAANKDLNQFLNEGAQHDVRTATRVANIQKGIQRNLGKGYDELGESLEDKQVLLHDPEEAKATSDRLKTILSQGNFDSPEVQKLAQKLDDIKNGTTISANDYLTSYRGVRDLAREATKKAYTPGINAMERDKAFEQMNQLNDEAENMRQKLEDSIPKEDYQKFTDLNNAWRDKVVPLYRNRVFKQVGKNQMPDNIAKALRGDEAGNTLIQDIIKNDPESLRNVIGQRYFANPKEVLNPNETMQSYLDASPEAKMRIANKQAADQEVERALNARNKAEATHAETIKQFAKNKQNAQKYQELKTKAEAFDQHIANLKKLQAQKNLSLAKKMQIEKDLSEAMKRKQNIMGPLKTIGKNIGKSFAAGAGMGTVYGLGSAINNLAQNISSGSNE